MSSQRAVSFRFRLTRLNPPKDLPGRPSGNHQGPHAVS